MKWICVNVYVVLLFALEIGLVRSDAEIDAPCIETHKDSCLDDSECAWCDAKEKCVFLYPCTNTTSKIDCPGSFTTTKKQDENLDRRCNDQKEKATLYIILLILLFIVLCLLCCFGSSLCMYKLYFVFWRKNLKYTSLP